MFRRGNPFVHAREETSSTHRASHLRAGLSLSWPSHVHIQPNLLKSCHGVFIQTKMPERKEGEEPVIMITTGVLFELMVQLDLDKYGPCVVFERG